QELIGDILVISNVFTLGVNEENILQSIQSVSMRLMALEKTLRAHLLTEDHAEIKDQISRAFGLLLHSYQLQTKEALDALSLIKLGVNLDWISGITDDQLNTLFFKCRRAHLLQTLGETQTSDPQHIARKRAEFLHKNMQGVTLKYESTG
ncbi:MAG: protein arginine kinase, partial [Chlamydiota bacterium]